MYPIYMQDEHPLVSSDWIVAQRIGVVQLDGEAQGFERDDFEVRAVVGPFLEVQAEH